MIFWTFVLVALPPIKKCSSSIETENDIKIADTEKWKFKSSDQMSGKQIIQQAVNK